ncbi:DUF6119 family protein [Massilia varians]|uniref:DUF6119 family protein n=1 Tax=Massilia varians TaxID=457921 RepID=UPI002555D304|nr:DUF6119 family protein [Massilia varians]MDK6076989.1 TIGR04141 family sporadically distributed protein [Massilia varians]
MSIDKVTIYRIKSGTTDFTDFLRVENLRQVVLPSGLDIPGSVTAVAAVKIHLGKEKTQENIPWLVFLNDGLPSEQQFSFRSRNSFPSGVVALKFDSGTVINFYVITFGLAADGLIDSEYVVRDFGLRVGMNICDPNKLKRVQTSIHESVSTQSERQISAGSSFSVFNIDDEKEFLRTLAGAAQANFNFVQNFVGRDSISIKAVKGDLAGWKNLVERVHMLGTAHDLDDFKTSFPGYAKFHFENDPATISQLDSKLFDRIKNKEFNAVHIAPPELLDLSTLEFSYGKNDDRFDDLVLGEMLASRRSFSDKSNIDSIKNIRVNVWNVETGVKIREWSGYKSLVAEVDVNNEIFILSNGQWKKVSLALKAEVDEYLRDIPINTDDYLLEKINIWDATQKKNREGIFNAEVAAKCDDVVLFDTAKIAIAGQRFYETCDVLHKQKKFIQVKRFSSGSASVSHLFVQGRFYAQAFLSEENCRGGMRAHIEANTVDPKKTEFLNLIPSARKELVSNSYTVVFCILTAEDAMDVNDLPFMARYELVHTHRHLLSALGMNCEIAFRTVELGP